MTEKLSFAIQDVELISENPQSNFAVVSLDFFASGKNLHQMYVSEDTLMRTSNTIKNCPLVWKYDEVTNDVYTHDKDEVPCGFVPENSPIITKKLPDGRTMLSVVAYIWKRYTGELLGFFKRDGGSKPVSVEMTVKETRRLENGLIELLDFVYEGITVLGSYVTPAIPLANAKVLSFSEMEKEYNNDFEKEFSYTNADLRIPEIVKENAKTGLELRKEYNQGSTSVSLSFAKYLTTKEKITPEKARFIAEYFEKYKGNDFQIENPPSNDYIDSLLMGGITGWKWAQSIVENIDKEKRIMSHAELLTFPYKSKEDINPALKGINPPISVSQANEIARQAEGIGVSEEKNGWAIAISNFKKTHIVKDGKWVKKTNNEEMSMEKEIQEKMAAEEEVERVEETPTETEMAAEEEERSNPSKEKLPPEGEKKEEKKFEFPKSMSLEKMSALFSDDEDEDDDVKGAKEEMSKGWEFANPQVVMAGMYAKMCKMAEIVETMAAENKVYMKENEELKKFKADLEQTQKNFEIEKTLKELAEKVIIPDEAREEMLVEAEKYSFSELGQWQMFCKAKSFDFTVKETPNKEVQKVGMPFTATDLKKDDDLWS